MKIPWLCVLVFLAGCTPSWAEDGYAMMKSFIQQEDERLKDIKILTLDLEKSGLELKKKEIQVKMAELSGAPAPDKGAGGFAGTGLPDVRVSGIVINDRLKQAFISVDGKVFPAREGQELENKMKIIKITGQSVSIQCADGQTRQLGLSGG